MPTGTVLFWRPPTTDDKRAFGFIAQDGSHNVMSDNVWFGTKEANGITFRTGDRVEFTLDDGKRSVKGPRALTVRMAMAEMVRNEEHEQITTHHGIDEFN